MAVFYPVSLVTALWLLFANFLLVSLNENSWLAKKSGFHGFLTVSNRAKGITRDKRPQEFFAWDLLDPATLVSGHCVGAVSILVYRVFVFLVFTSTIAYQGLFGAGLGEGWLIYFTDWTFTMMGLYALLGIIVCSKAISRKYEVKWGSLEKAFIFVFLTACSSGILLSIFYWTVLFNGHQITETNLIYHGGSSVLMLGELFLSRIPVCSYHLQIPFHYLGAYGAFFSLFYVATGVWVYPPLSFESYMSFIYTAMLTILLALSFSFLYLVACLREKAFSRCGGRNGPEKEPSLETLL